MTRIFIQQLCVCVCVCVCGLVQEALCLVLGRRGKLQIAIRHTLSSSLVRQAEVNNSL